ncbi:MAG TPA: hypothetical protein ENG75_00240 [Nitrospirae bacterium]|nr:hypothetical protein [Nitrospirota bacterium]
MNNNLALLRSQSLFGLEDAASVATGVQRQHHMFARLYKPDILPSLSFEWYGFASLEDWSGLQTLHTEYSVSDLYNLYLRIEHFWGHSTSEFGLVPDEVKGIIGFSMFFGSEE